MPKKDYKMSKVLFVYPNKWGRGITVIWVPSHSAALKTSGHDVKLFDCTFYENWSQNETKYNTSNSQYLTTDYEDKIIFNKNNIFKDLQKTIDEFDPDIIFGSAISSHIHGEGEYVNIQYFSELIKQTKSKALKVSGGLQATAVPEKLFEKFPGIDLFIRGESENVLLEIANNLSLDNLDYSKIEGLVYKKKEKVFVNKPQKIISDLDDLGFYDYSIFDSKVFLRPYNGQVLKAVDYELSRGCIYACSYCVETVLQKYYGFEEISNAGVIKGSKNYLRNKSADRIFLK